MRTIHKVLLGGAAMTIGAAVAFAGIDGASADPKPVVHHISVMVPGYGLERIDYTGNVAPRVVMEPAAMPIGVFAPSGFDRVFAQMQAIEADMDRQMAASMAQAEQMQASGNETGNGVYLAGLPAGTQSYSMVTTVVGNHVCTRETRVTSNGQDARPQMISNTSGDCASAPDASGESIRASTPIAPPRPVKNSI